MSKNPVQNAELNAKLVETNHDGSPRSLQSVAHEQRGHITRLLPSQKYVF
jgi:hypothetical protein